MNNIYLDLTQKFNVGRTRAIISSGQAAVLHHLAVMSKDGDWIIREDDETMKHILSVLSNYNARYRFGAPLDIKWMAGGWSAHFEFNYDQIRVRADFITRPPRISDSLLAELWRVYSGKDIPFIDVKTLAEVKKTNREKDYIIIGELARLMTDPKDQILYSRSARELIFLKKEHPDLVLELENQRPVLKKISKGENKLEEALDAERRGFIHANEKRLENYIKAAEKWLALWPEIQKATEGLPLIESHEIVTQKAEGILPFKV